VLEENIMNTEWMCGFPDQLVIAAVGEDYLVSAFGNEELIANFEAKLQAAFGSAKILYEETITE
jgi:hypothetical protein